MWMNQISSKLSPFWSRQLISYQYVDEREDIQLMGNMSLERYQATAVIPDSLHPRLLTFRRRIVRALCVRICAHCVCDVRERKSVCVFILYVQEVLTHFIYIINT